MYAGLIFRRPVEGEPSKHDYLIECRSMGCFNGLNSAGAFQPRTTTQSLLLARMNVSASGVPSGVNYTNSRIPEINPKPTTQDIGDESSWELMGIGWFCDKMNNQTFQAALNSYIINLDYATMNCSEHIYGIYNGYTGDVLASNRDLTPKETAIKAMIKSLENSKSSNYIQYAYSQNIQIGKDILENPIFTVLTNFRNCYGQCYDFVGAERPAGMAVAYLQVFRNNSRAAAPEFYNTGSRDQEIWSLADTVYKMFYGYQHSKPKNGIKSMVAILSQIKNNGSDSDILSFTGSSYGLVARQASKYGIFSLSQYFDNDTDMISSGRYSKGSQSYNLQIAISNRARGRTDIGGGSAILAFASKAAALKTHSNTFQVSTHAMNVFNFNNFDTVQSAEQDFSRLNSHALVALRQTYNAITEFKQSLTQAFNELRAELQDFRNPFVQATAQEDQQTLQVSNGFIRWVSTQNDVLH